MYGAIKDVRHDRGFLFVIGCDGVERFAHHTQVEQFDRMRPGVAVEFEPVVNPRNGKLAAANVRETPVVVSPRLLNAKEALV